MSHAGLMENTIKTEAEEYGRPADGGNKGPREENDDNNEGTSLPSASAFPSAKRKCTEHDEIVDIEKLENVLQEENPDKSMFKKP